MMVVWSKAVLNIAIHSLHMLIDKYTALID